MMSPQTCMETPDALLLLQQASARWEVHVQQRMHYS
jgi:hypothetical protein